MNETWTAPILETLRQLREPIRGLRGVAVPDDARLSELLDTYSGFDTAPLSERPLAEAALKLAGCVRESRRGGMEDALLVLADALERGIDRAVERGERDERLILTADFGPDGTTLVTAATALGVERTMVVGRLDALPVDHPLRSLVPADGRYRLDRGGEALVLGFAQAQMYAVPIARSWYVTAGALAWTAQMRGEQKRREAEAEERKRRDRLEEAAERQRFLNSPEGQIAQLRERLAALEAEAAAKHPPQAIPVSSKRRTER